MSRIGKLPITIPAGVEIKVSDKNLVTVKGALGSLQQQVHPDMTIEIENGTPVSYTHLRAHETPEHLVCRLLLEKKNNITYNPTIAYHVPSPNTLHHTINTLIRHRL